MIGFFFSWDRVEVRCDWDLGGLKVWDFGGVITWDRVEIFGIGI